MQDLQLETVPEGKSHGIQTKSSTSRPSWRLNTWGNSQEQPSLCSLTDTVWYTYLHTDQANLQKQPGEQGKMPLPGGVLSLW